MSVQAIAMSDCVVVNSHTDRMLHGPDGTDDGPGTVLDQLTRAGSFTDCVGEYALATTVGTRNLSGKALRSDEGVA
jgi:hypothetical protein